MGIKIAILFDHSLPLRLNEEFYKTNDGRTLLYRSGMLVYRIVAMLKRHDPGMDMECRLNLGW